LEGSESSHSNSGTATSSSRYKSTLVFGNGLSFHYSQNCEVCQAGFPLIGDLTVGYLLERVRKRSLAKPLHDWLGRHSTSVVQLRPGASDPGAAEVKRWDVLVSKPVKIET